MNKVFYDKARNIEVVDVSGQKSVDQIKALKGNGSFQEITLQPGEAVEYKDGNAEKFNLSARAEEIKNEKQAKKDIAIAAIKETLKLSDEDFENLKLAIQ